MFALMHSTRLYGTAIGAGTLFLPINAGVGGFWPLIVLALLAFPMTFFAHRGLTRFVLSGRNRVPAPMAVP
jgi:serine transporter